MATNLSIGFLETALITSLHHREKGDCAFLLYLRPYRAPGDIFGFGGHSYIEWRLPGKSIVGRSKVTRIPLIYCNIAS